MNKQDEESCYKLVTPEEYEKIMEANESYWPRVYMTKEEAKKWWPEESIPTPAWEKIKEHIQCFIEKLKEKGK